MTPDQLNNFRANTDEVARSPLAGGPRFLCQECKKDKPLLGRKKRATSGFRCGDCAAKHRKPLIEALNG